MLQPCLQAICPIITTGIPIAYFIITIGFSLCPGPISAFLSTAVSSITAFNPLTTIAFMGCYRRAALRSLAVRCSALLKPPTPSRQETLVTNISGLEMTSRVVTRGLSSPNIATEGSIHPSI